MAVHEFKCSDCNEDKRYESPHTTGYGTFDGLKVCFDCCGKRDEKNMDETGKATLYLAKRGPYWYVSNWPDTLKICINFPGVRKGRHNIAGVRYDVWFNFGGFRWHGTQYGDRTQLCHCKRTKHYLTPSRS